MKNINTININCCLNNISSQLSQEVAIASLPYFIDYFGIKHIPVDGNRIKLTIFKDSYICHSNTKIEEVN